MGPSALRAEVAAKVVLIRGSRDGLAWTDAHPDLAALVVLDDGTMLESAPRRFSLGLSAKGAGRARSTRLS